MLATINQAESEVSNITDSPSSVEPSDSSSLPVTSSPILQAHTLWQYFDAIPKFDTFMHPALRLSSSVTSGLGLSISSPVAPHTTLLRLPRSCHLRPDSNYDLAPTLPRDDPFLSLCLTLLYERALKKSSVHKRHIDALPTHFDLPLTWSATQLTHLSSTSVALRPPIADLATDWTLHIQPYLAAHPSFPRIQPLDHQWAVCCVLSRGFRDRNGRPCMVPLLDYCNTVVSGLGSTKAASCYIGWDDRGAVQLLSGADGLGAGEEVTIAYGEEHGNSSLLQRYGFVDEDNQEDTCDLDVQQLANIARDMGAMPQSAAKHRKVEKPKKADANGETEAQAAEDEGEDEDEEEEGEDDGIDEFIDQLPEEFIPLTMPSPYPSSATPPPLPLRLLKLVAALLSYYPTHQLILHTDVKPFALSLPLLLDDRSQQVGQDWVTSAELKLEAEEELDVLQLLWVALNERLAVLGAAEGGSGDKPAESESEEDGRRRRMAEVLKASERRIVMAHNDNVKKRIAFLMASLNASSEEEGDEGDEEQEEDDEADEADMESIRSAGCKTVLNGKRRR